MVGKSHPSASRKYFPEPTPCYLGLKKCDEMAEEEAYPEEGRVEGINGHYDEWGEWIPMVHYGFAPPEGHLVDAAGRLLGKAPPVEDEWAPEEFGTFVSEYRKPFMSARVEGQIWKYVWPDIDEEVRLQRLDIFDLDYPKTQQASTDREESRRIRATPLWFNVGAVFFLNVKSPFTKDVQISSTGPPKRHKYIIKGKKNTRDLADWVDREIVHAFIGSDRIPGTLDFSIDYCDGPDRYFISGDPSPEVGRRRLYRFAAYPSTQYYILEKRIYHESLESEGGSGLSYKLFKGNWCFMPKGWKIIGSFFAFDKELMGSSLFTVYSREDPFPRLQIAVGPIARAEEWTVVAQFYAFDIPLPGTCFFTVQHCTRSIFTAAANVSRMRITTADPLTPWEFRMFIYVFPAELDDCTLLAAPRDHNKLP